MTTINEDNWNEFLNGWKDNKVRVLLFGKMELVRLRYLALAFKYKTRATFGWVSNNIFNFELLQLICLFRYVQLNQDSSTVLRNRFGVPNNLDSLLLFHEDNDRPVVRLSMADLPYSTMTDVIDANKYLQLPRLSSQVNFI